MQDVCDKLLQQFVACIEGQFADAERAARPEPAGCRRRGLRGRRRVALTQPVRRVRRLRRGRHRPRSADAAAPRRRPRPLRPAPAPAVDDSIDLGATVLPVLVNRYAPYARGSARRAACSAG